ncbi:uncharacterized protein MCYG_04292 [Microsporum canis CBS 113480]|uniref:Uncharacterized protein n=1 Tax=Arthroderma otae (strain ATCC MYA-4605 / CBS 113480) TaxID=554155 RepID=C5FPF7_ARTOC|nr:uncharacterized protein MCYG_04292 [Microsporum canis CBS 113480]EEQ31473.1 predicted protein [Microsporum canis CBS 113480]
MDGEPELGTGTGTGAVRACCSKLDKLRTDISFVCIPEYPMGTGVWSTDGKVVERTMQRIARLAPPNRLAQSRTGGAAKSVNVDVTCKVIEYPSGQGHLIMHSINLGYLQPCGPFFTSEGDHNRALKRTERGGGHNRID